MTGLEELYREYAPDVFRFALYLSGNREDAEDITSETFVRAWTASGRTQVSTMKGYLFAIARNLFLHGLRRSARRAELSQELRDPAPGPHERAEGRSELAAVMARLQRLPEMDRSALIMRAVDELPYEEIALALGISPASARVKVHRARLKLEEVREL